MRPIWATVGATWAMLTVLAVLAWTRPQPAPAPQQVPSVVSIKGKNGAARLVVVPGSTAATHGTTRTSSVPAG